MRLNVRVSSSVAVRGGLFMAMLALAGPASAQDIVLTAASATRAGKWAVASDTTSTSGKVMRHIDAGATKLSAPQAAPANYFEMTFTAQAGKAYRVWMRGRAQSDYWGNDSVFVQFDNSVTSSGGSIWRIGTTSGMDWNLEDCSGCGLKGWKWQDNGWGSPTALGPLVYFSTTGTQRIRIQTREDGLSIDQIIVSSSTYLTKAPSSTSSTAPPPPSPPPPTSSCTTPDPFVSLGGGTCVDGAWLPPGMSAPAPPPAPTEDLTAPSTSTSTLKVLQWNIHHGVGTDGKYNIDRIATWIVKTGANVVSLNEVERYTWWGNEDQPARFAALLKAKTGATWYYNFAQKTGAANGEGNLLLSRFPLESSGDHLLSASRSVARIAVIVNGIRVNVFSTHLDASSQSTRVSQMKQLISWAATYPEQRVLAGDFNCYGSWIATMTAAYYDAWAVAVTKGLQVAYSGNTSGYTKSGRIDYVFHSKTATRLTLTRMQIFDTRDSSGRMPSDHRPIMATYTVK